jgi:hypothetical protein
MSCLVTAGVQMPSAAVMNFTKLALSAVEVEVEAGGEDFPKV